MKDVVENGSLNDFQDSVIDGDYSRGGTSSVRRWSNSGSLITLSEQTLLGYWERKGLVRTYCELPISDALKGGVEITADNFNDDVANELEEIFLAKGIDPVKEVATWARFFGGAGLIVINNGLELSDPFVIKKAKDVEFIAVDRWRLGGKTGYKKEGDINVLMQQNNLFYYKEKSTTVTNGVAINNERIKLMHGDNAPIITRQKLNGWGLSIIEKIRDNIDLYEQTNELLFDLLKEGKVNIVKINGLIESLSAGDFDHVVKWTKASNQLKKAINTLVMDSKDDYQQTQSNLGGFSDILNQIRINCAADLRMPMTKLWGVSSAGFNSGEDDIENYNAMINSDIRPELRPIIQWVLEILCYSELGIEPKKLKFKYKPLREMSSKDIEEINEKKHKRFMEMYDMGLISEVDLKEKFKKEGLL